jgi:DNA-directed RNA polymerase subunit RPC12/RpoP
MEDLFKNTFLCKDCNKKMRLTSINKNGFNLRAVECKDCNNRIIHPSDEKEYEEFKKLKEKEYGVKMRLVGNSYTVSIPREIVSFMREQEKMIDDMVKLSMMDMGGLNLRFHTEDNEDEFKDLENGRRVISREVKVVRNGKPVYHKKEYSDSANPQKNKKVEYSAEGDKE